MFRTLLHDDIDRVATSASRGFFQNIGDTRRQGIEAGINYRSQRWSAYLNYSLVQATFQSALTVPSPSNPLRDASGDIQVEPGDHLPGIPDHRLKVGLDYRITPGWTVGATMNWLSDCYYVGDEFNKLAPIPGFTVVDLHTSYSPASHVELFVAVSNLFDSKYATWGILSDPTGTGAAGIPSNGATNARGVDNRFISPAAPFEVFGGLRVSF